MEVVGGPEPVQRAGDDYAELNSQPLHHLQEPVEERLQLFHLLVEISHDVGPYRQTKLGIGRVEWQSVDHEDDC